MRFPRYVPQLGIPPPARVLIPPDGPGHVTLFARGREALAAYFNELPRGRVLLSAQICPAVPYLLRERGFELDFADVAPDAPCPGPEQIHPREGTVAVVLSPLYGQAPRWSEWTGPRLVLDLAQGVGELKELYASADAIVYSFGLGKGADVGGGLLLTRTGLTRSYPCAGYLPIARTLAQGLALRLLQLVRIDSLFLDPAVEADKEDRPVRPRRVPRAVLSWWERRTGRFLEELARARRRGGDLRMLVKGDERALQRLRAAGVDALRAGEPLPGEYLPGIQGSFPNARRFRESTLRLPFVGRMSEAQFTLFRRVVEECLGTHPGR